MNSTDDKQSAENIFWQSAEQGLFMLPRCKETGRCFFYPRDHSPFTGGEIEWIQSTGRGVIYSCSVSYRAEKPYCIAYIKLDDGPIILSNVVADDLGRVEIGQRVRVCFLPDARGHIAPFFTHEKSTQEPNSAS